MYRLKLPATSANLGPGFDSLGLAMALYLEIEAEAAAEFRIDATGRDAATVGSVEQNLMLETYRDLAPDGPALRLTVKNEIPLGMGCGSSAAALVAGVMLANEFGRMNLTDTQVAAEACRREGHPDNVAACIYGGMTASGMDDAGEVQTASFGRELPWGLLLVLPPVGLATERARALLPNHYSRRDAVANVQATALITAAFAQGRPELLRAAARDRLHQPYRMEACPLLPLVMPLAGTGGIYSVTLSGAGPGVLLITDREALGDTRERVLRAVGSLGAETVMTAIAGGMESPKLPFRLFSSTTLVTITRE